MICYDRLWAIMQARDMTQYRLIKHRSFSASQIGWLKKDMHVSTHTLGTLCILLDCDISDIIEYVPEGQSVPEKQPAPEVVSMEKGVSFKSRRSDSLKGGKPKRSESKKSSKPKKNDKEIAKGGREGKKGEEGKKNK